MTTGSSPAGAVDVDTDGVATGATDGGVAGAVDVDAEGVTTDVDTDGVTTGATDDGVTGATDDGVAEGAAESAAESAAEGAVSTRLGMPSPLGTQPTAVVYKHIRHKFADTLIAAANDLTLGLMYKSVNFLMRPRSTPRPEATFAHPVPVKYTHTNGPTMGIIIAGNANTTLMAPLTVARKPLSPLGNDELMTSTSHDSSAEGFSNISVTLAGSF